MKHKHLPDELWIAIFRRASVAANYDGIVVTGFSLESQGLSRDASLFAREHAIAMSTKRTLVRVCKTWRQIGTNLLYESIVLRRHKTIKQLMEVLRDFEGGGEACGAAIKSLFIFSLPISTVWRSEGRPATEQCLSDIQNIFHFTPNLIRFICVWNRRARSSCNPVMNLLDALPPLEQFGWRNPPGRYRQFGGPWSSDRDGDLPIVRFLSRQQDSLRHVNLCAVDRPLHLPIPKAFSLRLENVADDIGNNIGPSAVQFGCLKELCIDHEARFNLDIWEMTLGTQIERLEYLGLKQAVTVMMFGRGQTELINPSSFLPLCQALKTILLDIGVILRSDFHLTKPMPCLENIVLARKTLRKGTCVTLDQQIREFLKVKIYPELKRVELCTNSFDTDIVVEHAVDWERLFLERDVQFSVTLDDQ